MQKNLEENKKIYIRYIVLTTGMNVDIVTNHFPIIIEIKVDDIGGIGVDIILQELLPISTDTSEHVEKDMRSNPMSKLLEIDSCFDCKHYGAYSNFCLHPEIGERKIDNVLTTCIEIPEWCPLEDAEERQHD